MAVLFDNAVDISLGTTGAYADIDVSASVPAGATGVIVRVINTHASTSYSFGLRKNGSTDDNYEVLVAQHQVTMYMGVDANRVLEGKIADLSVDFQLLGYFTTDAVFFDNAYDKTPTTSAAWVDIDCSAEIPAGAKFALFDVMDTTSADGVHFRNNGSTDDRWVSQGSSHLGVCIGVDANRICEAKVDYYPRATVMLVGYITEGAQKTDGVDVSLTAFGAYTDIDMTSDSPPAGAVAAVVEVFALYTRPWAIRKDGSTDDLYYKSYGNNGIQVIGMDADIFEGKTQDTNVDFYVLGYLVTPAAGGSVPLSGSLAGASTVSGTAKVARKIAGAINAVSSMTATISVTRPADGKGAPKIVMETRIPKAVLDSARVGKVIMDTRIPKIIH